MAAPVSTPGSPSGRRLALPRLWIAGLVALACGLPGQVARAEAPALDDAGEYRVVRWTTADGLPQNTVNDIVVSPNGELWLATFGGLARFDGQAFHILDIASDAGLPDNRVLALIPASADTFWFLTHHGHMGRVRRGRAETLVTPPATFETLGLHVSADGRAYSRAVDGSVWVADRARWHRLLSGRRQSGTLHGLATTADGHLWASTGDQLVRLEHDAAANAIAVPPDDYALFRRTGRGLWLGTVDGLAALDGGRLESIDVRPHFTSRVTVVEQERHDVLWVASSGDVSRLERQPEGWWRRTSLPIDLPGDHYVRSLRLDGRGGVWIGTTGLGLIRVERPRVRRIGDAAGVKVATALASDGAGGAFLVDWCRGLVHVDGTGAASRVALRDPAERPAFTATGCSMSLAATASGRVWVRAESRLFEVQRQGLAVRRVRADLPSEEGPMAAHRDGSVWIASRGGDVQQLAPDGSTLRRVTLPPPLVSASVAPDGALWIGGDGQIFRVGPKGITRFGAEAHVPRAEVRDILVERDDTAWIATYGGGLGRLREGRVIRLSAAQGLPDNSLSRILPDGRGRFWIATNRGIAVVARDDLQAVADGRRSLVAPVVFGVERGVDEATFGRPAGFADVAGRLWFGTITGAVSLDTARFPFNTAPPLARVEDVSADGRAVLVDGVARIPSSTSRIRLQFSAAPLVHPERVRFRFRVDGVDDQWVDIGTQRTVDWSPPAPGRHRLLVAARNEDGVWSATPIAVVLDVLPAWWQTVAFRATALVGGVLAIVTAFRLRVRAIERRHAERLRRVEEQRQAKEHVASLRAQLEHVSRVALAGELAASLAHEVSQPLAAMLNNAEAGKRHFSHYQQRPDELEALLADIAADGLRASEVVRGLRAFLRPRATDMTLVDLSTVVRDMLPLVDRELRDHHIVLDRALADDLPPVEGVSVQLGQIVVNLLLNACEALADVPGERRVQVETSAEDGTVRLAVRDNGPGLSGSVAAHAFDPFVTTKPDGLGMGLAICRAIAEAHGGHLTTASTGSGLDVTLVVPAASHTHGP